MTEIITIQISRYLTNELAEKIARAQGHSDEPAWINRIRQDIFDDDRNTSCFEVVATNAAGEIIGRAHCIQNEQDVSLWYYGDLFVIPTYRRMGIATRMVNAVKTHLTDMGAGRLRCYVDPKNFPSIRLQESLGFSKKEHKPFNGLSNEEQIMLECDLPSRLSFVHATSDEAYFVRLMFVPNRDALHCGNISLAQWRELLSRNDPDEVHFLLCRGAMPIAYMKLNGLQNDDMAWVSMLFVEKKYHRQGIGSYALNYAEEFIKNRGFFKIGIQTDSDNIAAQNLYVKRGYLRQPQMETRKMIFMKHL